MTISIERLLSGSTTVDWVSPVMTGTTKQVTEAVELADRARDVSWAPAWTDTTGVTGVFGVDLSNDAIKWTPGVLDTDFFTIADSPAANDETQRVHGPFRSKYVRLTYTNATNTGTLTQGVHVNGKRGLRGARADTPILIYGSACTAWYNLDSRVMATPPNIETLTNLANTSNANITQGTDAQRPHLIDIGGKNYADFAADQNLNNLAVVTDLFPVAAPAVTAYFVGRFDAFTNTNTIFDFGTTLSQTGIAFASRTAGIRIIVHAGAVQSIFDHVYSDTGLHFFEVRYDGTNVTLYIDSVQVNQFAKTGTMTNACDAVSVGQHTQSGNQFNGAMRDIVLVNGTPTEAQRKRANTWGMRQV